MSNVSTHKEGSVVSAKIKITRQGSRPNRQEAVYEIEAAQSMQNADDLTAPSPPTGFLVHIGNNTFLPTSFKTAEEAEAALDAHLASISSSAPK